MPAVATSDPPGTYMGRRIAPTMSHEGADWLTRPEREEEERASKMLDELRLRPGDVACDVGAGNGYHTLEMAKRVAPSGRAIAVDIQPEMLALLEARAKSAGISNVELVLGAPTDPKLPAKGCDLILLADVYHELDDPAGMLAKLRAALSARGPEQAGRLVLLEFRAEDDTVPIKPEHKMSRAQILRELEANGFVLARSYDELPWQHLMFFTVRR
jgi:ubiquinone/menaquinone biosynthesis C-methylase UbiE